MIGIGVSVNFFKNLKIGLKRLSIGAASTPAINASFSLLASGVSFGTEGAHLSQPAEAPATPARSSRNGGRHHPGICSNINRRQVHMLPPASMTGNLGNIQKKACEQRNKGRCHPAGVLDSLARTALPGALAY
jgi:hypothetical protein